MRDAGFDHFLDERRGKGLVGGELDGAFGNGIALELIAKSGDDRSGGEEAAVLGKRGVPHKHAIVAERRDAVAEDFGRSGWNRRTNRCADFLQGAARWLRCRGQVFVDGF